MPKKILIILCIISFFSLTMLLSLKTVKAEDPPEPIEPCPLVLQDDGTYIEICEDDPNYGGGPCQSNCW